MEKEIIKEYTRTNAYGMQFFLNDWSVFYDIAINYMKTGMYFGVTNSETDRGFNGKFYKVSINNCDTGIYIDKTNPTGLKITYSNSIRDVILETISFGFYNSEMTVTLEATDIVSKIDHFVYKIGNGDIKYADSMVYNYINSYDVVIIYKQPNIEIIDLALQALPMCTPTSMYVSDNLNHYAFRIFY